jgi:hypothetical protein
VRSAGGGREEGGGRKEGRKEERKEGRKEGDDPVLGDAEKVADGDTVKNMQA